VKLGNVIASALVSSFVVLFVMAISVFWSWVFQNGMLGAMFTFSLAWAWLLGYGVLANMEKRS